jgi:hypothetical protein
MLWVVHAELRRVPAATELGSRLGTRHRYTCRWCTASNVSSIVVSFEPRVFEKLACCRSVPPVQFHYTTKELFVPLTDLLFGSVGKAGHL